MRHYLCQRALAFAPAPGTQGVVQAPGTAVLVASASVTLQRLAGGGCARTSAVALAPVAVATDADLRAATRAQKESGRLVQHERPRQTGVCWTGSPTGATIKPHPVFDTLKGAVVGTNLPVGTAAAPAYLGVGVLQRSRLSAQAGATRQFGLPPAPRLSRYPKRLVP